jgi:glycosyltransferase involved in cell wall biosynthesis
VPDLTVVLAGRECETGYVEHHLQPLGDRGRRQVIWSGPLTRDQLAAVLPRADAAVLPSRSDNLPNTVIEALAAGVPVVGSDGASIDELVRPDVNGLLVPIADAPALADAMAAAWRGNLAHLRGTDKTVRTLDPLRPQNAIAALMQLAGCADDVDQSATVDCTVQANDSYPNNAPDARQFTPARRAAA